MKCLFLCLIFIALAAGAAPAQTATHEGEAWAAYISSIRLNKRFALWNDFHYVTGTFFVSRHGLTYSLSPKTDITGGYAWVITSANGGDALVRPEHRPWGQIITRGTLAPKIGYQARFRYDARFRKKVLHDEVIDEWGFNHRLRLMGRLRIQLKEYPSGWRLHTDVMDEFLFNAGRQVKEGMDQNRLYLMLGLSRNNLTILGGYYMRALPENAFRHGAVVWVVHTISGKGEKVKR